ncbi:hypothetical protein V5799_008312 [Amblyomma americanum]
MKKHFGEVVGGVQGEQDLLAENTDVADAVGSILSAYHYPMDSQKQTESKRVDSIAVLAAISWWFLELYINVVSPRALAAVLKARSVSLASFEKELTLERLCVVQFHQAYAAAVTAVLANYYFRSQICRRNMVALLDDVRRLVAQASAQTSATDVAHQWRSAGIRIWPRLAALRAAQRLMLEHEGAAAMVMPNALDNGER